MQVGENRSDVEAELESEDPTEVGGTASSSKDGDQEVVVTSLEHCEPTAMSAGDGQEVERHGDVPTTRKHAASSDTIDEREPKRRCQCFGPGGPQPTSEFELRAPNPGW